MNEDATAAPEIPPAIQDALQRALGNLRMLPEVAQQALLIASSADCDHLELANVIQRDIRLTTFILRIANSSIFGSPKPIASLPKAILFIGHLRVQHLIIASSLHAMSGNVPNELRAAQEKLWLHGFLAGVLATRLNQLFGLEFDGEEFTAGLLHDFGRTLILIAEPLNAPHLDPLDFVESSDVEDRERTMLGISHAELGAWFAAFNELPASLISVIRFHHHPRDAGEWKLLTALVSAADHAANSLQRSSTDRLYDPASNPAVPLLEEFGVSQASATFAGSIQGLLDSALNDALAISGT